MDKLRPNLAAVAKEVLALNASAAGRHRLLDALNINGEEAFGVSLSVSRGLDAEIKRQEEKILEDTEWIVFRDGRPRLIPYRGLRSGALTIGVDKVRGLSTPLLAIFKSLGLLEYLGPLQEDREPEIVFLGAWCDAFSVSGHRHVGMVCLIDPGGTFFPQFRSVYKLWCVVHFVFVRVVARFSGVTKRGSIRFDCFGGLEVFKALSKIRVNQIVDMQHRVWLLNGRSVQIRLGWVCGDNEVLMHEVMVFGPRTNDRCAFCTACFRHADQSPVRLLEMQGEPRDALNGGGRGSLLFGVDASAARFAVPVMHDIRMLLTSCVEGMAHWAATTGTPSLGIVAAREGIEVRRSLFVALFLTAIGCRVVSSISADSRRGSESGAVVSAFPPSC